MFEELLYDLCPTRLIRASNVGRSIATYIVPKDILYELQSMDGHNLFEDLLLLVNTCCLNLLLDEARAVLVATELHDVAVNVLQQASQWSRP